MLNLLKTLIRNIKKLREFLGFRVIKWLFVGAIAGSCLGYVEFLVAVAMQFILKELNILGDTISLPAFLSRWIFSLTGLFIFFTIVLLLRVVFQFLVEMSGMISYVVMGSRIRISVFYELLQRKNPKFLSAANVNFLITEISQHAAAFCNQAINVSSNIIQCLILVLIMIFLSWKATLLGLFLFSFVGIILIKVNRSIHPVAKQLPEESFFINKGIQRIARNWLLVYILRTNSREYEHIVNSELRYRCLTLKVSFLNFISSIFPQTLGMFMLVAVIFANIKYFHIGSAAFLSFIYIFLRFVQTVAKASQSTGRAISQYPHFKIALTNFFKLSKEEIEASNAPTKLISIFNSNPIYKNERIYSDQNLNEVLYPPQIEFKNVNFYYKKNLGNVLEGINFLVEPGQQIGVIGRSGSGKSTMLGLILGLLHPTEGNVFIDKVTGDEFYSKNRLKTGYVGPEPFLIEGSIKDNLRYGHFREGDISLEQFYTALRKARLYDFIQSIPQGLEYKLTENGEELSAGQKQRLALARAILIMPKLLILDEVSSNLDVETELEISKSIKELKGECTIIIVSHKPAILEHADRVIDLDRMKYDEIKV